MGALHAAPGCSEVCSAAPGFLLNGSAPSGSVPRNRRYHRPALAPVGTAQPPAEEAEVKLGEVRAPEPAESAESAERYYPVEPALAGSASGSSPRPVLVAKEPAEGVLVAAQTVKAPADWGPAGAVPADLSPGSAAVAIPAA